MNHLKELLPWWSKIVGKIILSRVRLPYRMWRKLGVFQHGAMLDPDYAIQTFSSHWEIARSHLGNTSGCSILELGPGDSLFTAVLGAVAGAREIWLIDAGNFAADQIDQYAPLLSKFSGPWEKSQFSDVSAMLEATHATYLTNGLQSLRTIPSASIDFIFSQAVLEHIPYAEFEDTMAELFRIQAANGISSHRIDLQDHLTHGLNSLRFSQDWWEKPWFAMQSGFYTNRLRAGQIISKLEKVGYQIIDAHFDRWDHLPINRRFLASPFDKMSDDELRIRGMNLVVRK